MIPKPFWITRRLPAVSKVTPRGCVRPPATFTALQPGAVRTGKWRAGTPEQVVGIPVCMGPGLEVGKTVVTSVVGCADVVVALTGTELVGGATTARFAATSRSKLAFWPRDRSKVQ